jgi:C-terminal processing protease CtpA/Prc
MSGDLLVAVNTSPVDENSLDQANRLLDGPVGSKATLRLRRAGRRTLQTVEILRSRTPTVSAVDTASLPGGIGRLVLRDFPKGIADSVRLGVQALRAAGPARSCSTCGVRSAGT